MERSVAISIVVLLILGSFTGNVAARERYEPPSGSVAVSTSTGESEATIEPEVIAPVQTPGARSRDAVAAPAVEDAGVPLDNVRAKPESRPMDIAAAEAPPAVPRLDDPVLRWLPEIIASAGEAGVPPELIAGVMRIESNGDPNIISPVGARGLMQIMPEGLIGMGIPEYLWHDPATNIRAGAFGLAQRAAAQGSWEGAVGAYLGFGCDIFGTCTDVYISVVFGWASFYYSAIVDPMNSGYAVLGPDWTPPVIAPFVEAAPWPVQTPPPSAPPAAPKATATPAPVVTTEPADPPSDLPPDEPSATPVDALPGVPTEVPTEAPSEPPSEEPVAPPAESETPTA